MSKTIFLKQKLKKIYWAYLRLRGKSPVFEKKKKRRYIHPELSVLGFLNQIKDLDYVVLRWHEELPRLAAGEDIDILVSDNDLEKMDSYLQGSRENGIPCDIYTCGGLPGTDYRSVSYYPVKLAEDIVKNSILHNNLVKIPSSKDYFFSMAYHALYHKGFESGLASEYSPPSKEEEPDHDYRSVLLELAQKAAITLPDIITLETLDQLLLEAGWRPQSDTLKKLAKRNSWARQHFFSSAPELAEHWRGFTLFIIREKGSPFLTEIGKLIWDEGFQIILEQEIPPGIRKTAAPKIRGGNWNRGPWPENAGPPVYLFALYDLCPLYVDQELAREHPGLENARIAKTKQKLRYHINNFFDQNKQCNVVHSADNPEEALEYLEHLVPSQAAALEKKINSLKQAFITPYPVIKSLSRHARRAKVELIKYKNEEAVCKTFKPGRERFMQREILARKLKGDLSYVSDLLETGSNYIILKKYSREILQVNSKYLPVKIIKAVRKVIAHYRAIGYELIDFTPGNLILDRQEGLKVIDFEFLQEGRVKTPSLKGCYAWYHLPADFTGDKPQGKSKKMPYYSRWSKRTGLPLAFCVYNLPAPLLSVTQLTAILIIPAYRFLLAPFRALKRVLKRYPL